MPCLFCLGEEFYNHHGVTKQYKTDNDFVCSRCTQALLRAKPENLMRAYDKAKRLGRENLVKFLDNYVEGDENGNNERDMDGKRIGRETRVANHKDRAKHTTRQLDKGRAPIRRKVR